MHDSLADNDGNSASDKGYGYSSHYGFHPYGHPASAHHDHHYGGFEYGGHFGAPSTPPFAPQPHQAGYSYGSHYGSSEFGHGFSGHSFGGQIPPGIFGQIGQGNVNNGFPVGFSGYG